MTKTNTYTNKEKDEYIHELLDRTNNVYDIFNMMISNHPGVEIAGVEKEAEDALEAIRVLYNKIW